MDEVLASIRPTREICEISQWIDLSFCPSLVLSLKQNFHAENFSMQNEFLFFFFKRERSPALVIEEGSKGEKTWENGGGVIFYIQFEGGRKMKSQVGRGIPSNRTAPCQKGPVGCPLLPTLQTWYLMPHLCFHRIKIQRAARQHFELLKNQWDFLTLIKFKVKLVVREVEFTS